MKTFSVRFSERDSVSNGLLLARKGDESWCLKLGHDEIPCLGVTSEDLCSQKAHWLNAVNRGPHISIYKDYRKEDAAALFLVEYSVQNVETVAGIHKFSRRFGRTTLVAVEYQPDTNIAAISLPGGEYNTIFHIKGEERARMLPEKEFNRLLKKAVKSPEKALELLRMAV